jgi:hypothetical protein
MAHDPDRVSPASPDRMEIAAWLVDQADCLAPPSHHTADKLYEAAVLIEAQQATITSLEQALADAVQTARNYYALFHDETWKSRMDKWESALTRADGQEPT